jgi:ABC-type transport system substrate-binding protein
MQIHELTQKPLKEGVLGAIAGGIAKQATQQFVQNQTGIGPDRFAGQRVAQGQRSEAGLQMNAQLMQQLAKKGQEAWVTTQQELAKRANPPVASAAELPVDQLKPHLETLIDQLVGNNGYTKDTDNKDPATATGIDVAKDTIDRSIDKILGLIKSDPDQAKRPLEAAWLEMTTKGIGPLQTYTQPGTESMPQMHPDAAKLVQSLGQAGVQNLSKVTQGKTMNKTGNPAVDGLLAAAGVTLR